MTSHRIRAPCVLRIPCSKKEEGYFTWLFHQMKQTGDGYLSWTNTNHTPIQSDLLTCLSAQMMAPNITYTNHCQCIAPHLHYDKINEFLI